MSYGGDGLKSTNPNLKMNDLLNLQKVKERDLAILNQRNHNNKIKENKLINLSSLTKGDNPSDYKKAKKLLENKQSNDNSQISKIEYTNRMDNSDIGHEESMLSNKLTKMNHQIVIKPNYDELNKKNPQEKFIDLFKVSIKNSKLELLINV